MDRLVLPSELAAEIVEHARQAYPEEACGLVAGRAAVAQAVYRGRNVSPTPRTAFELDVETLARQLAFADEGLELAAIYHSHPAGPAAPSPVDVALAFYPDAVALICDLSEGEPVLRGFRIAGKRVTEVQLLSYNTGKGLTSAGQ